MGVVLALPFRTVGLPTANDPMRSGGGIFIFIFRRDKILKAGDLHPPEFNPVRHLLPPRSSPPFCPRSGITR